MQIVVRELLETGFAPAGSVIPDPSDPLRYEIRGGRKFWKGLFRVDPSGPRGPVMYIMTVNNEVMKVGTAGTGKTMFIERMKSEFRCLRQFIAQIRAGHIYRQGECLYYAAPPTQPLSRFEEDFPWKHRVPLVIESVTVDFWVRTHDGSTALTVDEKALNLYFRGEWANEGWEKVNGDWVRAAVPSPTQIAAARAVLERYRQPGRVM